MKLTLLSLLIAATTAHAHLIDLTPGGYNNNDPIERYKNADNEWFHHTFFDDVSRFYGTWTSLYGHLNGGTYFFTDFVGQDTTTAHVWWDMTGEPHGYWMSMLYIVGIEDGEYWGNVYRVTKDEWFNSGGNLLVRAHEGALITDVAFAGTNHVIPDTGATLGLFFTGLFFVAGLNFIVTDKIKLASNTKIDEVVTNEK
jgi:hypothetical protein